MSTLMVLRWLCALAVCLQPVQAATAPDLVINEILFNPSEDGFDYVEVFNRSRESINIRDLLIAKRNVTGDITGVKPLPGPGGSLPPNGYLVVTGNEKWLRQQYRVGDHALVCQVSSMPSFPDNEGSVLLIRAQDSTIIDELRYDEKWHFALISNRSGVALERINSELPTQDRNNWTSASSTSGFGTPGYGNSQSGSLAITQDEGMTIDPLLFSPDNDGQDDFAVIRYHLPEAGFVMNLSVFDLSGKSVRDLLKNEYLGLSGQYRWDGLDNLSRPLPQGLYVFAAEIFNINGRTKKYRKMITLARRY